MRTGKLQSFRKASSPRMRGSICFLKRWMPACAGMTRVLNWFHNDRWIPTFDGMMRVLNCRMLSILLVVLLSGCAKETVYQPVDVALPVAVPCKVPEIKQPEWPLQRLAPEASLFRKTQAALAELDLRKAYEAQMEAAVSGCR